VAVEVVERNSIEHGLSFCLFSFVELQKLIKNRFTSYVGLGIAGRTVLGSVADSLVHNAGCTVVVVKNDHRHRNVRQTSNFGKESASKKATG